MVTESPSGVSVHSEIMKLRLLANPKITTIAATIRSRLAFDCITIAPNRFVLVVYGATRLKVRFIRPPFFSNVDVAG